MNIGVRIEYLNVIVHIRAALCPTGNILRQSSSLRVTETWYFGVCESSIACVLIEYWADLMNSVESCWMDRIGVVLVTFNSADVIERAIRSLPVGVEVVVVDNASTDDSLALAKAAGGRCIRNRENLGFGRASNLGAAQSHREFILFLNPDAALRANAVEHMMAAALRYPDAGAIGPRLLDVDDHPTWRFASILHPMPSGATRLPLEPEATCCMPLLTGAALLCRRTAFEEVGGFDENIFLYHEDDDLCLRLTKAGWSLIYEPAAEVFHAFGRSSRRSEHIARFKSEQRLLSRAYISRKYGLTFDPDHEQRKSIKRLLIAIAIFDSERRAAALGRLDALHELRGQNQHEDNFVSRSVGMPPVGIQTGEFAVHGCTCERFDETNRI